MVQACARLTCGSMFCVRARPILPRHFRAFDIPEGSKTSSPLHWSTTAWPTPATHWLVPTVAKDSHPWSLSDRPGTPRVSNEYTNPKP